VGKVDAFCAEQSRGGFWRTPSGQGDKRSLEAVLENIHKSLYNIVGVAVALVSSTEKTWSQQEMVKRIVRAKSPELLTLHWEDLAKKLVDQAMGSYGAACEDKQWFYEIGLSQAFAAAAWELLCMNGKPRVRFSQVRELVEQEYEGSLDRTLRTKAMREATNIVFPNSKVQRKIFNALHKTYDGALDLSMADSRPLPELERVEIFVKKWIHDSMNRAWGGVEASEVTLTDKMVLRLFQTLMAPFGDESPHSCIPECLTGDIGRPPQDWKFMEHVVKKLCDTWEMEAKTNNTGGRSKKKRKGSDGVAIADSKDPPGVLNYFTRKDPVGGSEKTDPSLKRGPSPAGSFDPEDNLAEEVDLGSERQQHPDCTSAEGCIGHRHQNLIHHMVAHAEEGDVYCKDCWCSFFKQNKYLQGFWEDGPLQGQSVDMRLRMP